MSVSSGLVVGRGAGWGAMFGAVAGLLFPLPFLLVSDGMDGGETAAAAFMLGWLVMPIGLIFGLIAGLASGLATAVLRRWWDDERWSARLGSAAAGGLTILVLASLLLRPDFEVGPNETTEHVTEEIGMVFGPSIGAALLGLAFGPLLVRPDRWPDDDPT